MKVRGVPARGRERRGRHEACSEPVFWRWTLAFVQHLERWCFRVGVRPELGFW